MSSTLVYVLHSGNLYGTERMALATADGLRDAFDVTILAPPGPALGEAERVGFQAIPFQGTAELARFLRAILARSPRLAFFATGLNHSLLFMACNALARRPVVHLHMIHGGTDERLSYGRKRLLNRAPVRFVAVSSYVRERLLAHRVRAERIHVIENFLPDELIRALPRRDAFDTAGVQRVVLVSRVDPIKRVDLVLDALQQCPDLATLSIRVLGSGWELEALRARAAARFPNVEFVGFCGNVPGELAASDLLVHTCPQEPFGLSILEAMAAGVPVLVPDEGGAASLVEDGVSGLRFRANDAASLATRLRELREAPPDKLNALVQGGQALLAGRFSARERIADYRRLVEEVAS